MPQSAKKPVPPGMATATIYLWFDGNCAEAIEFYQKAFGAIVKTPPIPGHGGKGVLHAMLHIGDSNLMLADASPGSWEHGPREGASASVWLYVEDCEAVYQEAVLVGCAIISEMADTFWGDRMGKLKDPFGHCWAIASRRYALTPREIEEHRRTWERQVE
jgi:uncharacterized glyoxalase superfamily protein PhnB